MAAIAPVCDFGWKPSDAVLVGVDGNRHSIFSQAGANGLVVAFICNHCPYVIAVIDRMVADARVLAGYGIGFAAICANDAESHPADSFKNMKRFAREYGLFFPYLRDETQAVARSWNAVCTPDFFGFNKEMELQYRGRLDASRKDTAPPDVRRDLLAAMIDVARTGKGPADQIPSMGCSIKWKDAA